MKNIRLVFAFISSGLLNAQDIRRGLIMSDEGFDVCAYLCNHFMDSI